MATVREFRVGDGEQLVEAWRRSLPYDPVTPQRFRNLVLLDVNFDPAGLRVAVDGERIVGAAYAVRRTTAMVGADLEPGMGWLPFFFVAPEARNAGVGSALLDSALEFLRAHDVSTVEFAGYTPNYIAPGLDAQAYPEALKLLQSELGARPIVGG